MGKLFVCVLFLATAPLIQAQVVGRPVTVVSSRIQTPLVVHVQRVNPPPQARSFANTLAFRSLYNPLGNNPIVNPPGQEVNPAPRPTPDMVRELRRVPLGTTIAAENRTAVNGYTIGQVRQVQAALHRLGYYNGDVDGDFGPNTQTALERYQVSAGEPVTGTLTRSTLARLGISGK